MTNKVVILLFVILLSNCSLPSTYARTAGDLEGTKRNYKLHYDVKLTSQDGKLSQEENCKVDMQIQFVEKSNGDYILAEFRESIEDFIPFWSYFNGEFEMSRWERDGTLASTYNISLQDTAYNIKFSFLTLPQTNLGEDYGSISFIEYYMVVGNTQNYFDNLQEQIGQNSGIDITVDDTSFVLTSLYVDENSSLLTNGSATIIEIWEIKYDANGLLESVNYDITAKYNDIEIVNASYKMKSGFFRALDTPGMGIFLFAFLMLVPLAKRRNTAHKD